MMTIKEIAEVVGVHHMTVIREVRRQSPTLIRHGIKTLLDEEQCKAVVGELRVKNNIKLESQNATVQSQNVTVDEQNVHAKVETMNLNTIITLICWLGLLIQAKGQLTWCESWDKSVNYLPLQGKSFYKEG